MRVTLVKGDITAQEVDAVVNAANTTLLGGGGVDGAIHRRGGREILKECRELRERKYPNGLPTGQAVATTAGNLPARWVIHAVGPRVGDADAERLLGSAYASALHRADEVGARSVAFPSISTGVYGYPREAAATISVEALRGATTTVERVLLVAFDDRAAELWRAALA